MNNNLYGNTFPIPKEIIDHLVKSFRACPDANRSVEGYRRNLELQKAKTITYQQLKRMKNWFDGYTGRKEDQPYILNGGDLVRQWTENVLGNARDVSNKQSERMSYYSTDSSEYTDINVDPTTDPKTMMPVTESIKRINNLIKKIENADFRSN